jgi:hypothetical protein
MALQKQKIAMPIVDGIDTKGDSKTVLPTRFLELENVVFTNPGSMKKRFGYKPLNKKIIGSSDILSGSAVSSLSNELVMYSNNRLYSYSEGEEAWSDKGEIRYCNSYSVQVSADAEQLLNPSSFTYENITCYASEKKNFTISPQAGSPGSADIYVENTTIQIIVIDNITNTVLAKYDVNSSLLGGSLVNANYKNPKVGFAGSNFIIFFNAPDVVPTGERGFRFMTIDYLMPEVFSLNTVKINSTVVTHYDVCSFDNRCFVSFYDGLDVLIKYVDSDLSVSTATSTSYSIEPNNISLNKEGSNLRVLISASTGSLAIAYLYNFNVTAPVHLPFTIPVPTPAGQPPGGKLLDVDDGIYTITGVQSPDSDSKTVVFMQLKNWALRVGCVASAEISSAGVYTLNANPVQVGVEIQSKAVVLGDYAYIYAVKNIDPNYSAPIVISPTEKEVINKPVRTLYLIKSQLYKSEISAQFEVDTACVRFSSNTSFLPEVYVDTVNLKFELPVASINSFQPISATQVLADTVIKKVTADFSQLTNYFDAEQGGSLYISGGLLKQYDGNRVVEFGFLDTPEAIKQPEPAEIIASTAGPGLSGAVSVYQYCVVYKWTDRTSKIHRSAPSRAVVVSLAAGTYAIHINFTPLYLSAKDNVEIEVYRTQANGSIFYKLSKVIDASNGGSTDDYITGAYKNNTLVKNILIRDTVFDEELQYSEVLYTTGGILENDAPLSSNFVTNYKSRLFCILSDGYTLQYSKQTGIGDPVRFNANFMIPLDGKGGKATCMQAMDDHLIIFKERAIMALTGEGPNELGQQDDYRSPYLVTSDAGCIDPNSIVESPNGILFKSAKGIYLLKRNFTLQYIGDSVEKYNGETIVSATMLPTVNQIRLITDAGRALVYDYYTSRWTTFTNIYGLDSIEHKGFYYFLKADGLLMRETPNAYLDNGQFIKMRIKSSWIQIAGVQGFERFYNMLLLGTFRSEHKLRVVFTYDFNEFATQETIIDTSILNVSTYGTGTYGTGVYGGEFPLYQWQVFPKLQKCQSFQYLLEDIKTTVDGASFDLSHVVAEIGIKAGLNKMNAGGKTYGAK